MNNVIVSLDRVSLSFEGQKRVLDQVDVTIKQGQHTLIKGASGSGKTSLLHIMAGLSNQFTGSAELLGHDLRGVSDAFLSTLRREKMGFVYQFHHLLPEFSVIENVMLPLLFNGQSRYAAQMQARRLLSDIGLPESITHQHVKSLSGGERQRVALARAVIHQPSVVFADEPTGCLDQTSSRLLLDGLFAIQEQHPITFILVSHDVTLNAYFKHHIELKDGKISK